MKRILLFVVSICCLNAFAGNRVTLVEHITGADCGPCATTNPVTDPVYEEYLERGEIALVKYQSYINGVSNDPMCKDNPELTGTRATYYSASSVPTIKIDGNQATFTSSVTKSTLTSALNNALAINSKWDINVDYAFNESFNKVTIKMDFKSLEVQTGKFVAQIIILEKDINYPTPPGNNHEKHFIYVARQMMPNNNGTTLKESWNANEAGELTYITDVPFYFRDLSQLAVVAFIQDNNTKNVTQASYAAPKPITKTPNLDVSLVKFTPEPTKTVSGPKVTIKNNSNTEITSVTFRINFFTTNTSKDIQWTGSLPAGVTSDEIYLPEFSAETGLNPYSLSVLNPNGGVDIANLDNYTNSRYGYAQLYPDVFTLPVFEDFERTTESGETNTNGKIGDYLEHAIINDFNWNGYVSIRYYSLTRNLGANNSIFAMRFNNFSNKTIGDFDEYYLPTVNLQGIEYPKLSFYHAYCPYNMASKSNVDTLLVQVSTDGTSWTDLYKKWGTDLNSTSTIKTGSQFVPTQADWKKTVIDLKDYKGQAAVTIRIRNICGYNNDLFLDQILVENNSSSALPSISQNKNFSIYPTVTKDFINVSFPTNNNSEATIKIYSLIGQEVLTHKTGAVAQEQHIEKLNLSHLNAGSYILVLNVNGTKVSEKITVIK